MIELEKAEKEKAEKAAEAKAIREATAFSNTIIGVCACVCLYVCRSNLRRRVISDSKQKLTNSN